MGRRPSTTRLNDMHATIQTSFCHEGIASKKSRNASMRFKIQAPSPCGLICVHGWSMEGGSDWRRRGGFFAALSAAQHHPSAQVVLFEKTAKLLSKVKISGGGRCNVTHHCFSPSALSKHYPRGGKQLKRRWGRFRRLIRWRGSSPGCSPQTESDGRMFPTTDSSQTIIGLPAPRGGSTRRRHPPPIPGPGTHSPCAGRIHPEWRALRSGGCGHGGSPNARASPGSKRSATPSATLSHPSSRSTCPTPS